jgi:DNA-binding NtrC family response regulator
MSSKHRIGHELMIEASQILVVEDDSLVSEVIEAALDGAYRVTVVDSAASAMGLLRQGGIRLMLLDCTLPGGVDHDLLPEADRRGTAVIMMSGDPGRMDALSGQPRPFILKPFTLGGLVATVEQVLATTAAREPQS